MLLWLKAIGLKILAIGAAIGAALLYGLARGSRAGKAEVEAKNARETNNAIKSYQEVQQNIAAKPQGDAAKALRDWQR